MKFNTPLPQSLSKECAKAAKIFQSFVDSRNNGLDGVIPRSVLQNAKGFAIFTVAKAGFVFSARAGSGVVIAKLDDGSGWWSAPSAIGTAGVGFGGQAGAEVTDFLVVLNTRAAIRSFMAAGSLTLGGNLSIALGPLGRNGEAIGSVSTGGKVAAMYSYSKTRGLFGGISVEGSVIIERQDANSQAYRSPVTVKMLLGGAVDPPSWAESLIKTLETCTGMPGRGWVHDDYDPSPGQSYAFAVAPGSQPSPSPSAQSRKPSFLRRKKDNKPSFPPSHWGVDGDRGSYFSDNISPLELADRNAFETNAESDTQRRSIFGSRSNPAIVQKTSGTLVGDLDDPFGNAGNTPTAPGHVPRAGSLGGGLQYTYSDRSLPSSRSYSMYGTTQDDGGHFGSPFSDAQRIPNQHSYVQPKPELTRVLNTGDGLSRAIALFDFKAVEDGDLSFKKGDVIIITKKSGSTDDWWTGRINDREGIFPANFVEVA